MIEQEIIQLFSSFWALPIVLIKKKNNKMRFCIDYRKLNKITKRDTYSLFRIDEILNSFGKVK